MRRLLVEWLAPVLGRPAAEILVPGWFAMIAAAGLVAAVWIARRARRAGEDTDAALGACGAGYLAAVTAGVAVPALYALAGGLLRGDGFQLRWAGMVSWCGYLAGGAAVVLYLRRRRTLSPLRFADLAAPALGLSLVCARLGCFLAGCDYGKVSSGLLAMRFPAHSPAWRAHVGAGWVPSWRAESLPVHPTQLYEAALGLALCVLCLIVARTAWARSQDGRVFAVMLVGYALGRIAIEALRGDAGRGFVGPLSSAQLFAAVALIAFAAACWRRGIRRAVPAVAMALLLAASPAAAQPGADPEPKPDPYAEPKPKPQPVPIQVAPEPAGDAGLEAGVPEVGAFLAASAPLNRRAGQVPALGGLALTATLPVSGALRAGVDLDSLANSVATHVSLLAMGTVRHAASEKLELSGRLGFGFTTVNFRDDSFTDQISTGLRAGLALDYALSPRWALSGRPVDLDLIGSPGLGGPILSWQVRVGLTYRHRD